MRSWHVVTSDPSGVERAPAGTIAFRADGARAWRNVDGDTLWVDVDASSGWDTLQASRMLAAVVGGDGVPLLNAFYYRKPDIRDLQAGVLDARMDGGVVAMSGGLTPIPLTLAMSASPRAKPWALAYRASYPVPATGQTVRFGLAGVPASPPGSGIGNDPTHVVMVITNFDSGGVYHSKPMLLSYDNVASDATPVDWVVDGGMHDFGIYFDLSGVSVTVDGVERVRQTVLTHMPITPCAISGHGSGALLLLSEFLVGWQV